MRSPLPFVFVALIALVPAGCAPADDASEEQPDVPVVRQVVDRDAVLTLHEELRIDGSRDDAPFFNIGWAALDADGRMFVLDRGNRELMVFDDAGVRIGQIGRQGQGPGEFMSPRGMWISGDSLAVADSGNRFHLFRTDGEHLETRSWIDVADGNDPMSLGGVVATPYGWLTSGSAYFRYDADGDDSSLNPIQRSRVFALDWTGDVEETGYRLTYEPPGQMVDVFFVQPPFSFSPRYAIDGLGRIHLVDGPEYAIRVHDATGRLLHIVENEYPMVEVTGEELDQWAEARACAPGQPECDESRTRLALSMDVPDYKPVVGRVIGMPGGHLAVMRLDTDPDPTDRLSMGEYDLFAPDGAFLGRLPLGLSPRWFDGTTLLATEWDDMMVPTMIRYRVEY